MMNKKRSSKRSIKNKTAKKKYPKSVKSINTITKMRKKAGLTCNALAEMSYVDPKYLWELENGLKRNPGRDILIRLVRGLIGFTKLFDESHLDKVLSEANYPPAPLPGTNNEYRPGYRR